MRYGYMPTRGPLSEPDAIGEMVGQGESMGFATPSSLSITSSSRQRSIRPIPIRWMAVFRVRATPSSSCL